MFASTLSNVNFTLSRAFDDSVDFISAIFSGEIWIKSLNLLDCTSNTELVLSSKNILKEFIFPDEILLWITLMS